MSPTACTCRAGSGPRCAALLDRHLGEDWWRSASDAATWQALDAVPDGELWEARREQRAELVEFVKDRSGIDRLAERQPRAGIEAAARAFDPDVLTIGFARRNATYKRIGLLIYDPGRTLALLGGPQRVQFVLAGKAHPSDEEAKRVVQELFRFKDAPMSPSTSSTCTTTTSGWPHGWCAAAICGSTSRARRMRPAGPAG